MFFCTFLFNFHIFTSINPIHAYSDMHALYNANIIRTENKKYYNTWMHAWIKNLIVKSSRNTIWPSL
jgi:hypothetical protein